MLASLHTSLEQLKPAVKVAYSAFLALPEEDKQVYVDFLEHQLESQKLYELMQEGDQNFLTEEEQDSFIQALKVKAS